MSECDADDPATGKKWCLFRCSSRPSAMRLDAIREVVRIDRLVRLPLGPPRMVGLLTLRRYVIPVFMSDESPGPPAGHPAGKACVLVLQVEQGPWGLMIDDEALLLADDPEGGVQGRDILKDGVEYAVIDPAAAWREVRDLVRSAYQPRDSTTAASPAAHAGSPAT